MQQADQLTDNMEIVQRDPQDSRPKSYNKAMLQKLYIEDGLSAVEIADLYDQKYDVNKIKGDIKKWQLNTKFFTNHSITQKLDAKYEYYSGMIKSYFGANNKFQAKYRELTNVVQEMEKMLEVLKNILSKDSIQKKDLDTKAILSTVESIMSTSKINVVEIIKIQQKDQDTMIKINAMQDAILDKVMDARNLEIKQIDLEKILNSLYEQVKLIESQTNILGLSHNFRMNVRKTILKVTGSKSNILKQEEEQWRELTIAEAEDNGVKINRLQLYEAHQIMKKGIPRKEAFRIMKELTNNPELKQEDLIQQYINRGENELTEN